MNSLSEKSLRRIVLATTLGLFLLACCTPVLDLRNTYSSSSPNIWWGWEALLIGMIPILVGQLSWLANPLLLVAIILIAVRKPRAAAVFSVLALLFSADLLLLNGQKVPSDESGSSTTVLHQALIGSYLWVGSMVAATVGSVAMWRQHRTAPEQVPETVAEPV